MARCGGRYGDGVAEWESEALMGDCCNGPVNKVRRWWPWLYEWRRCGDRGNRRRDGWHDEVTVAERGSDTVVFDERDERRTKSAARRADLTQRTGGGETGVRENCV